MKQTLKIGLMLLVAAALVTTGIAVAQSDDDSSVFSAVEESAADDETALRDEGPVRSRILEWLTPLVDDDTITQEQADAVADTLADHLPRLRAGLMRGLHAVDDAADFLGMTGRELVEALRDGATLADLAEDHGGADALIDHLVGLVEVHLDQAVADGRLTEEEAAERLAEATERITALVNGELPMLGDGSGPGEGMGLGRHGRGMGNGPCQDETADSGITDLGT
ncbi:MAG: hypothetical protein H6Q11_818 [Acidobacteria bacterium]|nr:hypothetical protein [Acidobacteriota bacterium]